MSYIGLLENHASNAEDIFLVEIAYNIYSKLLSRAEYRMSKFALFVLLL